jgi:hypothetical protein
MTDSTTISTPEGASVGDSLDAVTALLHGDNTTQTPEPPKRQEDQEEETQDQTGEGEDNDESEQEEEEQEPGYTDEDAKVLAQALGIPEEEIHVGPDGKFLVTVKVDGQVANVPFDELKKGYQMGKSYTQRSQALAEEKKVFDTHRQQFATVAQQLAEKHALADRVAQFQHQQLLGEFDRVPWDRLRADNPGEYAAMLKDFEARKGQIDQLRAAIQNERAQETQQQQQQFLQQRQQYLADAYNKTLEKFPKWADPKVMEQELTGMQNFAAESYGISPDEFAYLDDPRHIEILRDAIAYRQGKAIADKKVKAPEAQKFIGQGRSSKPMSKLTQLDLAARKAQGMQKRRIQADAAHELLFGGN